MFSSLDYNIFSQQSSRKRVKRTLDDIKDESEDSFFTPLTSLGLEWRNYLERQCSHYGFMLASSAKIDLPMCEQVLPLSIYNAKCMSISDPPKLYSNDVQRLRNRTLSRSFACGCGFELR